MPAAVSASFAKAGIFNSWLFARRWLMPIARGILLLIIHSNLKPSNAMMLGPYRRDTLVRSVGAMAQGGGGW